MKDFLKSNMPFQFYSWMKLAALALYLDLFWGVTIKNTDLFFSTFSNLNISIIISFIVVSAAVFPVIVIFVYIIHLISLVIKLILESIENSNIIRSLFEDSKSIKIDAYKISYTDLINYALKEKNDIAYNLAISLSQKYKRMKYNRYIATAALVLLCFDINYGSILCDIYTIPKNIRYLIYFYVSIACYVLLCKVAIYNDSCYRTFSQDIYLMIKKVH